MFDQRPLDGSITQLQSEISPYHWMHFSEIVNLDAFFLSYIHPSNVHTLRSNIIHRLQQWVHSRGDLQTEQTQSLPGQFKQQFS